MLDAGCVLQDGLRKPEDQKFVTISATKVQRFFKLTNIQQVLINGEIASVNELDVPDGHFGQIMNTLHFVKVVADLEVLEIKGDFFL